MSLLLSEEQQEFRNTLRGFLEEKFTSEKLRERIGDGSSSNKADWETLLELGLSSSFGSERFEGFGLRVKDLSILAFEAGYRLVPEPVVEHALYGSFLLSNYDALKSGEWKGGELAKIIAGQTRVTAIPLIDANSEITVESGRATGRFRLAPGVEGCDLVLFQAQSSEGPVLCVAECSTLELEREKILDETIKRCSGKLSEVPVRTLEISPELAGQLERVVYACQLAGLAARAVEMTAGYVKDRRQFEAPIGAFQAVQHRLSDMYLASEAMRALSNFAAWAADHSTEQLELAASSAIVFCCEKAPLVVEGAIQLHGGIGFTWEFDLHLYLRRAKMLQAIYRCSQRERILGASI